MGNFLKGMFIVTVMGLLYIHLQMNIYALAYQGKSKEIHIEKLAENNAVVKNDILRLKSSDHIGRALLDEKKVYQFASRRNVVEVESQHAPESLESHLPDGRSFLGKVMTIAFSSH